MKERLIVKPVYEWSGNNNTRKVTKRGTLKKIVIWAGRVCAAGTVLVFLWGAGYLYHMQKDRMDVMTSGNYDGDRYVNLEAAGTEDAFILEADSQQQQTLDTLQTSTIRGNNPAVPVSEIENWKLTLVNPWHTLSANDSIQLVQLVNGQSVDERCYPELQNMMDDCRAAGLSPYICSSYRTWEKQNHLFEENVRTLMAQGYSEEEARTETAKNVAIPGTSEHQLGLAVDIVDQNYQVLDEEQEDTATQKWLMENSWRYGFILRYPTEKSDITGIVYEPWHYRYVGKEAAEIIYNEGICLEEYLERMTME